MKEAQPYNCKKIWRINAKCFLIIVVCRKWVPRKIPNQWQGYESQPILGYVDIVFWKSSSIFRLIVDMCRSTVLQFLFRRNHSIYYILWCPRCQLAQCSMHLSLVKWLILNCRQSCIILMWTDHKQKESSLASWKMLTNQINTLEVLSFYYNHHVILALVILAY